jgi:hypothetical protein
MTAAVFGFVRWLVMLAGSAVLGFPGATDIERGEVFSFHRRSNYSAVVMFLALGLILEMPILQVLMGGVKSIPEAAKPTIHIYLTAVSVIGLLLLLGDNRQVRKTSHRVFDDYVKIQLGTRCVGDIPRPYISEICTLTRGQSRALFGGCKRRSSPASVALADMPNVLLRLNRPCVLLRLGGPMTAVSLGLFVDEPDRFVRALSQGASDAR